MIAGKVCECRDPLVVAGQVVRVDTCPVCLPRGAISWLIENGRQLDMFDPEPLEEVRVTVGVRGGDTDDSHTSDEPDLPF